MTRNIANRIGKSINDTSEGGIFNLLSQYVLNKTDSWSVTSTVTIPTPFAPQTYNPGDGFTYVVFNSTSSFTISEGGRYLHYTVIGGGGGGYTGSVPRSSGGGGAGGFRSGTFFADVGTYQCVVGSGAPNATGIKPNGSLSSFGSNTLNRIISAGGGNGGVAPPAAVAEASPGGSGGGGATAFGSSVAYLKLGGLGNDPPVSPSQGNNGGDGTSTDGAAGGGGAGGNGGDGTPNKGGPGGVGRLYQYSDQIPSDWGTPGPTPGKWFAGGGGGASDGPSNDRGQGGAGGGGGGYGKDPTINPSLLRNNQPVEDGTISTGGGGGGHNGPSSNAGTSGGGSGIIIIRY